MLLGENEMEGKADVLAKAIIELNRVGDDLPATLAVLYKTCKYFSKG